MFDCLPRCFLNFNLPHSSFVFLFCRRHVIVVVIILLLQVCRQMEGWLVVRCDFVKWPWCFVLQDEQVWRGKHELQLNIKQARLQKKSRWMVLFDVIPRGVCFFLLTLRCKISHLEISLAYIVPLMILCWDDTCRVTSMLLDALTE